MFVAEKCHLPALLFALPQKGADGLRFAKAAPAGHKDGPHKGLQFLFQLPQLFVTAVGYKVLRAGKVLFQQKARGIQLCKDGINPFQHLLRGAAYRRVRLLRTPEQCVQLRQDRPCRVPDIRLVKFPGRQFFGQPRRPLAPGSRGLLFEQKAQQHAHRIDIGRRGQAERFSAVRSLLQLRRAECLCGVQILCRQDGSRLFAGHIQQPRRAKIQKDHSAQHAAVRVAVRAVQIAVHKQIAQRDIPVDRRFVQRLEGLQREADQPQGREHMRHGRHPRPLRLRRAERVLRAVRVRSALVQHFPQEKALGGVQCGQIQKTAGQRGSIVLCRAERAAVRPQQRADSQLLQMRQRMQGPGAHTLAHFQLFLRLPGQPVVKALPHGFGRIRRAECRICRQAVHTGTACREDLLQGHVQRAAIQPGRIKQRIPAGSRETQDMECFSVHRAQNGAVFQRGTGIVGAHVPPPFFTSWFSV